MIVLKCRLQDDGVDGDDGWQNFNGDAGRDTRSTIGFKNVSNLMVF
jgi:hypothetical protein